MQKSKSKILGPVTLLVVGILALGGVSAVLLDYFGAFTTTVEVEQAITMPADCSDSLTAAGGETVLTDECTATSQTTADIPVEIATEVTPDDDGVESTTVRYNLEADSIPWGAEGYIGADFEAGRSHITLLDDMTLGDLASIDFEQYVTAGYPVSVNILLDVNGDGVFDSKKDLIDGLLTDGADDVLKIEWAYNGATAGYPDAYMNPEDYGTWSFEGVGSIDDTTNAWLYSVKPGDIEIVDGTLAEWKLGISRGTSCYYVTDAWYEEACEDITVDENTKVYGIQIESLGWIAESQSKVRNIKINDAAQDVVTMNAGQDVAFDLEVKFANGASGTYELETQVQVQ